MKVLINICYGGFGLSNDVLEEVGTLALSNEAFNIESDNYNAWRAHGPLIEAVEKIGLVGSADSYARLNIVHIPDDVNWHIEEYDGMEHVAEDHRTWG